MEFCLSISGTFGGATNVIDTDGWTDYPIGLTFNGASEQGNFVAMVTEANPGGAIAFMQTHLIEDGWGGWQYLANSPSTHLGPSIRVREADRNYDVIFAN